MSKNSIPKRRLIAWGVAAAVIVVFVAVGVSRRQPKSPPGSTALAEPAEDGGRIVVVSRSERPVVYKAVGTLRSRDEVELSPRIVARVTDVRVRTGDSVSKGDVLVQLDDSDLRAALNQAREQLRSATAGIESAREQVNDAQAALGLANSELARMQELYESGDISKMQYDQYVTAQQRAQAAYNSAQQRLQATQAESAAAEQAVNRAQAQLDDATIQSPMDGLVSNRLVDPGDLASPGNIMMRLFDPARIMLETPIRESLIHAVQIDTKVPFYVPAVQKTFEGDVREITPLVDPGSRTFLVKICVGETESLMPGMFGTIHLKLGTEEVLLAPEEAIVRVGQIERIEVVEKEGPRWALVRTIPAEDGMREVVSGLEAGARIRLAEAGDASK